MRRAVRRRLAVAAVAAAALLGPVAAAGAHVSVLPARVAEGETQEFTIRVPVERDIATTEVRVTFPDEITVYSFAEPPAGWTMRPQRSRDGRFTGVVYRGRVGPNRYVDFTVLGTPFATGEAVWPAEQVYADGRVKPWTGPPEKPGEASAETGPADPGPAAAVAVVAAGEEAPATAAAPVGDGDDDSGAAVWLGVIAIAISALAALGVGLLWSTRPARLPDDGDDAGDQG